MEDLKAGDVVVLKSRTGATMTIESLSPDKINARVIWFNGHELKKDCIAVAALVKIKS